MTSGYELNRSHTSSTFQSTPSRSTGRHSTDIPTDSGDMKITRAIIAMAHGLRLKVVAEGVETLREQATQFLRSLSCDAVQGYFLYRPLREDEVADALRLNRRNLRENSQQRFGPSNPRERVKMWPVLTGFTSQV